jgi:hypothetical protein
VKVVRRYQEINYVNVWENVNIVFAVSDSGIRYSYSGFIDSSKHTFIYKNAKTTGRISPAKLPVWVWGTYYGGGGADMTPSFNFQVGSNVCRFGSDGNLYFGTQTTSSSNIASVGAWQSTIRGNQDGMVAKFDRITGYRMWATYYGGFSEELLCDVALDSINALYVTGLTLSNSHITTPGTHKSIFPGFSAAFLARFTADSGFRVWGTYYGGGASSSIHSRSVAVNNKNQVVIVGSVSNFVPGAANDISSAGAHQPLPGGVLAFDGFVASFDGLTGQRLWGTYYGGTNTDFFNSVNFNSDDEIIACGITESDNNIGTAGTHRDYRLGVANLMLVKFTNSGIRLWGTYYGSGSGFNAGETEQASVTVSGTNNIYAVGTTTSFSNIATPGTHQTVQGGSFDTFIARFDNLSGQLVWGTYYGGADRETVLGVITVNRLEQVYTGSYTQN